MTKYQTYKCGPYTFKSYFKAVGHGFEVGFTYRDHNYFVGNFVHREEAMKWWKVFHKEIKSFSKKYWVSDEMPFHWYCNFLSNHLYQTYYAWLDKVFYKHETNFKKAYTRDVKRYAKYRREHKAADRYTFHRKAA